MAMMCGAPSESMPADEEVLKMCQVIRKELGEKLQTEFSEFIPISFRRQVVCGTNYFVKIHVGNGKHVHVRVFRPLQKNEYSLHDFQDNKLAEDSIDYF